MDYKFVELGHDEILRLRSVELGVTSRCNLGCAYCCAYGPEEQRTLSTAECISILESIPHLQRVKLSGGEVLLKFDVCRDVVRWCAARGVVSQINTNGTVLGEGRIAALADAGLDVLHVSLNFVDAQAHAAYYRVKPEVHERIVNAIRESVSSPIATVVETMLMPDTRDSLVDVHRAVARLGVRRHEIQMEVPRTRGAYALALSGAEIQRCVRELLESRRPDVELCFSCLSAFFGHDDPFWRVFDGAPADGVRVPRCIDGLEQLHVHSNGDVLICELGYPVVIGNVFQERLIRIFDRVPPDLAEFRRRRHEQGEAFHCYRSGRGSAVSPREQPLVPRPGRDAEYLSSEAKRGGLLT